MPSSASVFYYLLYVFLWFLCHCCWRKVSMTHPKHTWWAKLRWEWNRGLNTMQGEGLQRRQQKERSLLWNTCCNTCPNQFAWCKHSWADLLLAGRFVEPDRLTSRALSRLERIKPGVCSDVSVEAEHISSPFIRMQTYISAEVALLGRPFKSSLVSD